MFRLNLKIALRNLWRNKTSSVINIVGLAVGLSACLLLLLYVNYEMNFDRNFKDSDKVYQVMTNFQDATGKITSTGGVPGNGIAMAIRAKVPEVDVITRIGGGDESLIANKEKVFKKTDLFADPEILKIFNYEFIVGNPNSALNMPDAIVLTAETAKLLFGTTDVLNKTVRYNDKRDLRVTGVIKDLPGNTSLRFDYLMPWAFFESINDYLKNPGWGDFGFLAIAKVNNQANIDLINAKVKKLFNENYTAQRTENFLFPFADNHLHGKFLNGKSIGGDIERIYLFMALAFGILLVACINFMNMATAKSERRAKEVGIKKTIGATRNSLVNQFLTEAMVLTMAAVLIAVTIVELSLPVFNNLLDIKIAIDYTNLNYWLSILAVVFLTGLLAGAYPALFLSSFNPIQTLKKKTARAKLIPINIRQVLVVGQFCFAIMLIIATLVIYRQMQFIKNRPVGYHINLLAEMPQDGELRHKFELFKDQLLKTGAVTSVSQTSQSMTGVGNWFYGFEWPGMEEKGKEIVFNRLQTTYDFVKTSGVELVAGRDFSRDFASDTAAILLSSTAVKVMKLKNPIGTNVKLFGNQVRVIGVFKDFIWDSPYHSGRQMVINFNRYEGGNIKMRLNPANSLSKNVEMVSTVTKKINPSFPVEVKFVNELFDRKLKSERILGILANLFGGIAILISCLGLYGLVAYSAEQRTKEFGVRRVLGASVGNIMKLLSVSFLKMVFIAACIGVPLAYYLMNRWLTAFEFRTTISWSIILMSIGGTAIIAFLTVSFQAYKAATANPVEALKYE
ncbi:ABC transporter permease [Pedobacter caeni]|uniref:ABC-type transport system, involved in lipoprotein release, permease component n=1 Tax=Pedobacter caeni TaxID=288992 RepID=A0A1M4VJR2_9SPHI|nr:ABC transporter permease [Pedobacter caeni]SHE69231.1 ABC-type transport system, involved in lipoprotein release, permease component [Pedobacter caeni]